MPKLLTTPFASEATSEYRTDVQNSTGAEPNSATYEQGFPPITMRKINEDGKPPKGSDLNGVLYDITDNLVGLTKGTRYGFNEAYATAIGGYPLGAVLRLDNGVEVESEVDSNSINPNVDMTGWKLAVSDNGIVTWSGRTQRDENKDFITPLDYKAKGDGVTNDTQAFTDLELEHQGKIINLLNKTYLVTNYPRANKYVNGKFLRSGIEYYSEYNIPYNKQGVFASAGALLKRSYNPVWTDSIVAIGRNAMGEMTDIRTSIAIGGGALGKGTKSRDNIAIGDDAGHTIQAYSSAYDQSNKQGTRNICVGGNAGRHIGSGASNVCIGRNAGQPIADVNSVVAIGGGALVGDCPVGLDGKIANPFPSKANRSTLVGASTAQFLQASETVALGYSALAETKLADGMTAIGSYALQSVDAEIATSGKVRLWTGTETGTYVQNGTVLTLNVANIHEAVVGAVVGIRLLDGDAQTTQNDIVPVVVVAVSGTTLTFASPLSLNTSGTAQLRYVNSLANATSNSGASVYVGNLSGNGLTKAYRSVGVGYGAGRYAETHDSSVAVGWASANRSTSFRFSTAVGSSACNTTATYQNCIAIGSDTLNRLIDGSTFTSLLNSVAVGVSAQVSGNNEIQLGTSTQTTYVYGTVQNRSDARDKADIRDTELGLSFINSLRPVDYKWDMREDYSNFKSDGSKKRSRYHHGFIAQEVPKDFGGYQDHKINGGADVLSLGYDEFIAPIVKAMQELSKEVEYLKKQLESK